MHNSAALKNVFQFGLVHEHHSYDKLLMSLRKLSVIIWGFGHLFRLLQGENLGLGGVNFDAFVGCASWCGHARGGAVIEA